MYDQEEHYSDQEPDQFREHQEKVDQDPEDEVYGGMDQEEDIELAGELDLPLNQVLFHQNYPPRDWKYSNDPFNPRRRYKPFPLSNPKSGSDNESDALMTFILSWKTGSDQAAITPRPTRQAIWDAGLYALDLIMTQDAMVEADSLEEVPQIVARYSELASVKRVRVFNRDSYSDIDFDPNSLASSGKAYVSFQFEAAYPGLQLQPPLPLRLKTALQYAAWEIVGWGLRPVLLPDENNQKYARMHQNNILVPGRDRSARLALGFYPAKVKNRANPIFKFKQPRLTLTVEPDVPKARDLKLVLVKPIGNEMPDLKRAARRYDVKFAEEVIYVRGRDSGEVEYALCQLKSRDDAKRVVKLFSEKKEFGECRVDLFVSDLVVRSMSGKSNRELKREEKERRQREWAEKNGVSAEELARQQAAVKERQRERRKEKMSGKRRGDRRERR